MRTPILACTAVLAALCAATTVAHAQAIANTPSSVVAPVAPSAASPPAGASTSVTAPSAPATPGQAPAANAATRAAVRSEQVAVAGSTVPAGRVHTEIRAPYATVCGVVTDFARFREVFPMRESRVIHRRRGQAEVYFQVELARGAGTLWALSRFDVQRGPDVTRVNSTLIDGNLRRLDVSFEVRPVAGDASRSILSMQLLGLPAFYLPDGLLSSQQTRWAEHGIELLRARAESLAEPRAALR